MTNTDNMSNTLVSLRGVSKGQRGLNKVSENKTKNGHFAHVFPPNIYFPGSTRKPKAERHFTFKEKKNNLHVILEEQRSTHILLVTKVL